MKHKHTIHAKCIRISLVILVAGTINTTIAWAQTAADDPHLGIIPAPLSVTKNNGTFDFSQATFIKADNPKDRSVVFA